MEMREAIATLQLLVAVAKADGKIEENERKTLEDTLKDLDLPEGYTVDTLLSQEIILESVLNEIKSPESQRNAFKSAYLLAYADGDFSKVEKHLITTLQTRWNIAQEEIEELNEAIDISNNVVSSEPASTDKSQSKLTKEKIVWKYSGLNALFGFNSVPILPELLVLNFQLRMVVDIGKIYGYDESETKKNAKMLGVSLGLGTGVVLAVRSFVRLVPLWGNILGATTAFSSTYALGHACIKYFESGKTASVESLQNVYKEKQLEGKQEYKNFSTNFETNKNFVSKLEDLSKDLKAGKITQTQYQEEINKIKQNL